MPFPTPGDICDSGIEPVSPALAGGFFFFFFFTAEPPGKPYVYGGMLLLLSCFSRLRLLATPWTAAYQTPPSMGFSRQEYWSGLPVYTYMHINGKHTMED